MASCKGHWKYKPLHSWRLVNRQRNSYLYLSFSIIGSARSTILESNSTSNLFLCSINYLSQILKTCFSVYSGSSRRPASRGTRTILRKFLHSQSASRSRSIRNSLSQNTSPISLTAFPQVNMLYSFPFRLKMHNPLCQSLNSLVGSHKFSSHLTADSM